MPESVFEIDPTLRLTGYLAIKATRTTKNVEYLEQGKTGDWDITAVEPQELPGKRVILYLAERKSASLFFGTIVAVRAKPESFTERGRQRYVLSVDRWRGKGTTLQTFHKFVDTSHSGLACRWLPPREVLESPGLIHDLTEILKLGPTNRLALVEARLGQGEFRAQTLLHWGGRCAVTNVTNRAVLRASHVKAWRDCDESKGEHRNPRNGLPLAATLDALFDQHLISFDEKGKMLVSRALLREDVERLGLKGHLSDCAALWHPDFQAFLRLHRDRFQELDRRG